MKLQGRTLEIALFLFLLATPAASLAAQGAGTPPVEAARPRVAVTVVLQDTLAGAPAFRIIRRVDQRPLDVIVLTGPAGEETLSEAVRSLLMVRFAAGDTASTPGEVRVRRRDTVPRTVQRPYPWAARVVRDLHAAPPQDVMGIGRVRAVVIWFPPQHGPVR